MTTATALHEPLEKPSLTQEAARGFAWLFAQTVGVKLVSLAGQVVLAMLLGKREFGDVGLAMTVAGLAGLIQHGGLTSILVRRGRHLARWSTATFWLSLATGVAAAVAMAAAAPAAGWIYRNPGLPLLVLVLACAPVFDALAIVPLASLQVRLRYRAVSLVQLAAGVLTTALSVFFAWRGFGALSFVLPVPLAAAARAAMLWALARPPLRATPQVKRWRYLVGDGGLMMATNLFAYLMMQGDYISLGLFHDAAVVGTYVFAFQLSSQTIALLTQNLSGALFPALSRLQDDPVRQVQAFVRAAKVMGLVSVPACLGQAVLAGPLLRIAFGDRWSAAVPVLQVLSVGMALSLMGGAAANLIMAQGRFGTLFRWSAFSATCFLAAVTAAAAAGGPVTVAVAVAAFFAVFGPGGLYVAIRPGGGTLREVGRTYWLPFALGALAIGPVAALARLTPGVGRNDLIYVAVTVCGSVALYLPLVRRLAPAEWREMTARIGELIGRGSGRAGPGRNV